MMNFAKIMKQASQMKGKMAEMQEELESTIVEGLAGGGLVKVSMTANGKMTHLNLDPTIISVDDKEMLEDLIMAGINNALENAEKVKGDKMKEVTGGLNIPGLELPF